MANALRMHLLKDKSMREGIRFGSEDVDNKKFMAGLKEGFKKATQFLSSLQPASLLPPAIHIPRALDIDLDSEEPALFMRPSKLPKLKIGQKLHISPFFILTDLKKLP